MHEGLQLRQIRTQLLQRIELLGEQQAMNLQCAKAQGIRLGQVGRDRFHQAAHVRSPDLRQHLAPTLRGERGTVADQACRGLGRALDRRVHGEHLLEESVPADQLRIECSRQVGRAFLDLLFMLEGETVAFPQKGQRRLWRRVEVQQQFPAFQGLAARRRRIALAPLLQDLAQASRLPRVLPVERVVEIIVFRARQ